MSMLKPRSEYELREKELEQHGNPCVFCPLEPTLVIQEFSHWVWIFNQFPYWKFHTMLISKKHVLQFSELSPEAIAELSEVTRVIEDAYRRHVVAEDSPYGKQLLMFWRSRGVSLRKKSVEHLHLHFAPEHEHAWDSILDPEAHLVDIKLLTEGIR